VRTHREGLSRLAFSIGRSLVGVTGESEGKPQSLGSLETAAKVAKEAPLDERLPGQRYGDGSMLKEPSLFLGWTRFAPRFWVLGLKT